MFINTSKCDFREVVGPGQQLRLLRSRVCAFHTLGENGSSFEYCYKNENVYREHDVNTALIL